MSCCLNYPVFSIPDLPAYAVAPSFGNRNRNNKPVLLPTPIGPRKADTQLNGPLSQNNVRFQPRRVHGARNPLHVHPGPMNARRYEIEVNPRPENVWCQRPQMRPERANVWRDGFEFSGFGYVYDWHPELLNPRYVRPAPWVIPAFMRAHLEFEMNLELENSLRREPNSHRSRNGTAATVSGSGGGRRSRNGERRETESSVSYSGGGRRSRNAESYGTDASVSYSDGVRHSRNGELYGTDASVSYSDGVRRSRNGELYGTDASVSYSDGGRRSRNGERRDTESPVPDLDGDEYIRDGERSPEPQSSAEAESKQLSATSLHEKQQKPQEPTRAAADMKTKDINASSECLIKLNGTDSIYDVGPLTCLPSKCAICKMVAWNPDPLGCRETWEAATRREMIEINQHRF